MRWVIASIRSTFNCVVTGPKDDDTNFVIWAQAGIVQMPGAAEPAQQILD